MTTYTIINSIQTHSCCTRVMIQKNSCWALKHSCAHVVSALQQGWNTLHSLRVHSCALMLNNISYESLLVLITVSINGTYEVASFSGESLGTRLLMKQNRVLNAYNTVKPSVKSDLKLFFNWNSHLLDWTLNSRKELGVEVEGVAQNMSSLVRAYREE